MPRIKAKRRVPIRVLHVLGSMSRGGIETWLMHVFRNRRPEVVHELCLTKAEHGALESECVQIEIPIHRVIWRKNPITWSLQFYRLLRNESGFDVVHCHSHLFSGIALSVARLAAIETRIAHFHTVTSNQIGVDVTWSLYARMMRAAIKLNASKRLGNSNATLDRMFGSNARDSSKNQRLMYGFDFSSFRNVASRALDVRTKYRVPHTAPVFGHVGRFVAFKNHRFLIDVFAEIVALVGDAHLLLVGSGPLEAEIIDRVERLGLTDRVIFAGEQADIAAHMAAMDVFILPSWTEGLGIVAVEAQAAGTSVVMTDTVPREVDILPSAITRLSLDAGTKAWARRAAALLGMQSDRAVAYSAAVASEFNLERSIDSLHANYGITSEPIQGSGSD